MVQEAAGGERHYGFGVSLPRSGVCLRHAFVHLNGSLMLMRIVSAACAGTDDLAALDDRLMLQLAQ